MADITKSQYDEFAIKQLRHMLQKYPELSLDIEGVVLDYIGRSQYSLADVFELNFKIYERLFGSSGSESTSDRDIGKKLLACLIDNPKAAQTLSDQCKKLYPLVLSALDELGIDYKDPSPTMSAIVTDPSKALGFNINMVIWQISDVHFGAYNKLQPNPRELAFTLARLAEDYEKMAPDMIIVSGDISSKASPEEFNDFEVFCRALSTALWEDVFPERILVIPGNHDVTWGDDGSADQMSRFAETFDKDEVCITPFGKAKTVFAGGRIMVERYNPNPDTAPPFAIVRDFEHEIEFILLVSGYFSGNVPVEIREALTAVAVSDNEERLLNLLRLDEGSVNQEYLFTISKFLERRMRSALAVIHHNPIPYGVETCRNRFAPRLLETLWQKQIPIVLHGHIHMVESRATERNVFKGQTFSIPAPTLCSIPTSGAGRGLNIHFLGKPDGVREFRTLNWTFSESMGFNPQDAYLKFRLHLRNDDQVVQLLTD